jgi:hypothetical protein
MKARYPENWDMTSYWVRYCRAKGFCEECGAENHQPHPVTGSYVVLTTAHLDHTPENCCVTNLAAWCQRCHLAYDAPHHRQTRRINQDKRRRNRYLIADANPALARV